MSWIRPQFVVIEVGVTEAQCAMISSPEAISPKPHTLLVAGLNQMFALFGVAPTFQPL